MDGQDIRTTLARLEGFLKAFEWLNHKTNHSCSYFICLLSSAGSVNDSLAERFKLQASDFRIEAIEAVEAELRAVFARFLFLFQEPHGDHLVDPNHSFSLMDEFGRNGMLDELTGVARSLGIRTAWRIFPSSDCGELREWCFQDDIVLDLQNERCLLHFGVSD